MCHCEDNDPPEFFDCDTPTARKPHKCCECRRVIEAGEKYESARGKWDGEFRSFKTCTDCVALRSILGLDCWSFGDLVQDVYDTPEEDRTPEVLAFLERRWSKEKVET